MAFQLRRMVLVNAGTNKHVASGRITEIDPRGGAAVVGANAVGKTFTLRLIPLFFGHSIRDLVALEKGQEGVSFIFPSETSAVCFEYQRGSDAPEDLRLAVLRAKSDGSDAAEYRIFQCGFDKGLFVQDNRFLNDEASEAQARARGIASTKKMTPSEYRAVILRSSHRGHDARKLQSYGLAHSFGPKPLPNLDKLVAAMVKKGIRFDDLVAVAVGLIQDDLGLDTHLRTVPLRQQRGELERWLRNVAAAERAVKLGPQIEALNNDIQTLTTVEREWREMLHDVKSLIVARQAEATQAQAEMERARERRACEAAAEEQQIAARRGRAEEASRQAGERRLAYDNAARAQQHFTEQRAAFWQDEMARLEPLRNDQEARRTRLRVAQAGAQAAIGEHGKSLVLVQQRADESRRAVEARKTPLREQCERDLDAIRQAEAQSLAALGQQFEASKAEAEEQRSAALTRRAELRAAIAHPAAPADAVASVTETTAKLLALGADIGRAGEAVTAADRALQARQKALDEGQQALERVQRGAAAAAAELKAVIALRRPADGTLLSALRAHEDGDWKKTVARVLDPQLLGRTDLNAHLQADALSDSLYGWHLNIEAIGLPSWADDDSLVQAEAAARDLVAAAERAEVEQRERLQGLAAASSAAREALLLAQSEVDVVGKRRLALERSLVEAQAAVARAQSEARAASQAEATEIEVRLREVESRVEALKADYKRQAAAIVASHDGQRAAATQRRDRALAPLVQALADIDAQRARQIQELDAQLQAQMSEQGIDAKAIGLLDKEVAAADEQIRAIASQAALVASYHDWLRAGGFEQVVRLQQEAETAVAVSSSAALLLEEALRLATEREREHSAWMTRAQETITSLEAEAGKLVGLREEFEERDVAQPHERVDLTVKAEEMRRRVRDHRRLLVTARESLRRGFRECLNQLTMTESSVKQLIDGKLDEHERQDPESPDKRRAQALVLAYGLIADQVIVELNTTLGTVLNHLAQFRRIIASFESEVGRFNARLQKALGEITRFERLADLKLNIVADFTELDFYGKLKRMDEVMRRHQHEAATLGASNRLPAAETVEALRDFKGVLGDGGLIEVDLMRHIRLHGSVVENGKNRSFQRASELENVSSTGLTTLVLITLLVGLVQVVRRGEPVHVPWVTDEVGTFDAGNFKALLGLLADNRIDVITASPALDKSQLAHFAQRYLFLDRGEICHYRPRELRLAAGGGLGLDPGRVVAHLDQGEAA